MTALSPAHAADHATAILRAAISAADPAPLVVSALARAPELASRDRRAHVVAVGKAAAPMAAAALEHLGRRAGEALIVAPHGAALPTSAATARVRLLHGSHPLPGDDSIAAGAAIDDMLTRLGADDFVIVLISGGSSALAALPQDGISVDAYANCIDRMMRAGADIDELNAVRRPLDRLKGGGMARMAHPARVLGLVLSDVIGDRVDIIGSGPLTPAATSADDAIAALRRHRVWHACADPIRDLLRRLSGHAPPPAHVAGPPDVRTEVIGSNRVARAGAAVHARLLGYRVIEIDAPLTGEARTAGARLAEEALRVQQSLKRDAQPVCLLAGGETTVTVRGNGMGGRNQELVLAGAIALDGGAGVTLGSIGTDGVDGPTPAAGAVADAAVLGKAAAAGRDPRAALLDNGSHTFMREAGATIVTGPTGTNVLDVQLALVRPVSRQT